jgi:chromosome segregation ATPase
MANLTGLINDLERKIKERDLRIKKLEATLESAGIKPSEGPRQGRTPEEYGTLHQKVTDLEKTIQSLQAELEKQNKSPQVMGDLVKELQTKLRKRDDTIAKLDAEVKQLRHRSSPRSSPENAAIQPEVADLEKKIQSLQIELEEEKQKKNPESMGDLVNDLQTKLHKKDEVIAKLEVVVKQSREERTKTNERPVFDVGNDLGPEIEKKEPLIVKLENQIKQSIHPKVAELDAKILGLQMDLVEAKQGIISQSKGGLAKNHQNHKKDDIKLEGEAKKLSINLQTHKGDDEILKLEAEIKRKDEIIAKLENQIEDMKKPKLPSQERWWY